MVEKNIKSSTKQAKGFAPLIESFKTYENTDTVHKELEVRFRAMRKPFSKLDYDRLAQYLLSNQFRMGNPDGTHILRIQQEYTPKTRYFANIRTEINGLHDIQTYCRTNQIESVRNKNHIKKTHPENAEKNRIEPYDNDDFGFRAAFQLEHAMHENTRVIETLEKEWLSHKKTFRYLNRVEFVHEILPIIFHLTIVKSSRRRAKSAQYETEFTVQKAGLFQNVESYEFEMEVVNEKISAMDAVTIEKTIKHGVKLALCGIQNTQYPISYKEMDLISKEYLTLTHNGKLPREQRGKYYMLYSNEFIGPSSYTLQMSNIVKPSADITSPNIRKGYTVTEKADGERRLLYISEKGKCYFIDTNMNVQYIGAKTKREGLFGTILDGEYIEHNKNGEPIMLFACFDVYYIHGEDKRTLPFVDTKAGKEGRLHLLDKIVKKADLVYETITAEHSLRIEKKNFYYSDIFQDCSLLFKKQTNGLFEYNIDGLIFTPIQEPVPGGSSRVTWEHSFKWKPPEFNTIDFLVKYDTREGKDATDVNFVDGAVREYKKILLKCGFDRKKHGYIHPAVDVLEAQYSKHEARDTNNGYSPQPFYPTKPYDNETHKCLLPLRNVGGERRIYSEEEELIEDNTIVEFRYDTDGTKSHQWVPLRVRYDKTRELRNGHRNYGNAYHVANSNWQSIHNPITREMLSANVDIPDILDEDDDVYYNRSSRNDDTRSLRDFHNLVVKRKLILSVCQPGDTLIDYAVGKGGDFTKWIDANLSFVFGIDKSRDNIENWLDGAYARYLNYRNSHKSLPEVVFVPGTSGKLIRSGEAIDDHKYKLISRAMFGQGPKDAKQLGKGVVKHYGVGSEGFQISSCQFAIHYFFESRSTLENFIQNVIDCTKVGGYFIGTSYDGNKMFQYLRNKEVNAGVTLTSQDGNRTMWEVTKRYDNQDFRPDASSVGYPIDVYQMSINKTFREFLVNYEYLTRVMEDHGFQLLQKEEARTLGLPSGSATFEELYLQLEDEIERKIQNVNSIGTSLRMSQEEKTISFLNRYFVYKKIRHDTVPVTLKGDYDDLLDNVDLKIPEVHYSESNGDVKETPPSKSSNPSKSSTPSKSSNPTAVDDLKKNVAIESKNSTVDSKKSTPRSLKATKTKTTLKIKSRKTDK